MAETKNNALQEEVKNGKAVEELTDEALDNAAGGMILTDLGASDTRTAKRLGVQKSGIHGSGQNGNLDNLFSGGDNFVC